jgi:hypothetical protein
MRNSKLAIAAMFMLSAAVPTAAQQPSGDIYTPQRVWYVTGIDVNDGQFENYMGWLATEWKQFRAIAQKEGIETGYHVLVNNAPRDGEPDLYLVTINKDFVPIAQGLAFEKKLNAAMQKDRKQFDTESSARAPMRKVLGTMELTEMRLNSR